MRMSSGFILLRRRLERMGYRDVSVLSGGTNRWAFLDLPTEWGVNVPSKDFGERVEVVHHVPEIDADDLHARIERGDSLVILDTRTPEEYRRSCIPGVVGACLAASLAFRITDVLEPMRLPDATVVVNCAGRTRSIIGTRVLQRMSLWSGKWSGSRTARPAGCWPDTSSSSAPTATLCPR